MSFRAKPANRKQAQNEDESQEEQGGASRGTVPVPGLPADAKWAYALDQSNTIALKQLLVCLRLPTTKVYVLAASVLIQQYDIRRVVLTRRIFIRIIASLCSSKDTVVCRAAMKVMLVHFREWGAAAIFNAGGITPFTQDLSTAVRIARALQHHSPFTVNDTLRVLESLRQYCASPHTSFRSALRATGQLCRHDVARLLAQVFTRQYEDLSLCLKAGLLYIALADLVVDVNAMLREDYEQRGGAGARVGSPKGGAAELAFLEAEMGTEASSASAGCPQYETLLSRLGDPKIRFKLTVRRVLAGMRHEEYEQPARAHAMFASGRGTVNFSA